MNERCGKYGVAEKFNELDAEIVRLTAERDALATALLAAFNVISHYSMHMTRQIAKEHAEALEIAERITK